MRFLVHVVKAAFLPIMVAVCAASAQVDLSRPPTAADAKGAAAIGWAKAAETLGTALANQYAARPITTPAISQWLDFWQWCELFSRTEYDEIARFASTRIFRREDGSFLAVGPGVTPPDGVAPVPEAELRKMVERSPKHFAPLLGKEYEPGGGTVGELAGDAFAVWAVSHPAFSKAFFSALDDRDFTPAAVQILRRLYEEDPKRFEEYANAAIAMALVWDQPAPMYWPHGQVEQNQMLDSKATISERFADLVRANKESKLLVDVRKLEAPELKFVVDSPVALSELEWARKNMRISRASFDRAFSMIRYDDARIAETQYSWPFERYALEDIKNKGGICVDQAYFGMLAGKALGLPTLFFTGQGKDGGHAWFGYLSSNDRWKLDAGKGLNRGYPVGEALDPQTWAPISDQQLEFLSRRIRQSPSFQSSRVDVQIADILLRHGRKDDALRAVDKAIITCPENVDAWYKKADLLEEAGDSQGLQRHLEKALKEFRGEEEVRVRCQKALAQLAREAGDEEAAEKYEDAIIKENRRGRTDLGVAAGAQRLTRMLETGDVEEAMLEYRSLGNRLGANGGGEYFYHIVRPFTVALMEKGNSEEAKKAVRLARRELRPDMGSILDQDIRKLEDYVNGARSKE